MKVRTEQLTGAALDWAVARAEGLTVFVGMNHTLTGPAVRELGVEDEPVFSPSTDWLFVGALIEREEIAVMPTDRGWFTSMSDTNEEEGTVVNFSKRAASPLISALRCFVSRKIGDEVDLPDELVEIAPPTPCLPDNHVDSQCLTGNALNWVVARCVDQPVFWHAQDRALYMGDGPGGDLEYNPETNWEQGGPLINHYRIDSSWDEGTLTWSAFTDSYMARGSTALQAAMRALVTSHHGDTVVVPTELLQDAQVIGLDKDGNTICWNAETAQPYNSGAPY